jgi:hypothetical protein
MLGFGGVELGALKGGIRSRSRRMFDLQKAAKGLLR